MAEKTFEELMGFAVETPTADPMATLHDVGQDTVRAQREADARIQEETTTPELLGAAWDKNIGPMMWDEVQRKWSNEPESDFDVEAYVKENSDLIPSANTDSFGGVRSRGEADELRDDMIRQDENASILQAHGTSGMAAQMLVGMVDVDLPLTLVTGGWSAAGKMGITALSKAALAGSVSGAATMAASTAVDPMGDTKDIVSGALFGAGLGTVGGVISAKQANKAIQRTQREYAQSIDDLPDITDDVEAGGSVMPTREPRTFDVDEADFEQGNLSMGAASPLSTPSMSSLTPSQAAIQQAAADNLRRKGVSETLDRPDFADDAAGRTARKFSDALHDGKWMPDTLKTDFDRLATGGGAIEQNMAFELFESADGRIVNNRSASMLRESYENRLASHSMPIMDDAYKKWASARNVSRFDMERPTQRDAFDREVYAEMEARYNTGRPHSQDPAVAQMADALDKNFAEAIDIGKGRSGETSAYGWDTLEKKSGYMPHRWDGNKIRKLMHKGIKRERMEKLIGDEYIKTNPNVTPEDAIVISKAVVRRALNKADGVDANMLSTLDADGVSILEDILVDAGVPKADLDDLVSRLRGEQNVKGALGQTQHRMQMDMRATDGDLSLMDMVDTNMTRLVSRYNRQVSGAAALARKGITSRGDRKAMIDAAIAERNALNIDTNGVREYLEDVLTHFDAGPIAGGVSPWVARAKRITNLGLLNQMGLTQAMETGASMNVVGVQLWNKHAKVVMNELVKGGPEGPLAKELKPHMGELGKEHILQRDDLMMDELAGSAQEASGLDAYLEKLDFALGKGQRLQGHVSGFYAVRGAQQKIAVVSMADKVMQRLRDGADLHELEDIGVPHSMKKYIDNGTVEFMPDGTTNKLNLEQWAPEDAEELALALHRHTNKVVQKSMAGEDSTWMHKSVGSMFMHLKSFPLLAMRKQFVRNAALGNERFVGQLMMGLGMAALMGTAKQVINGRSEHVDPASIAKNAFGMSNMTGWFPMLVDPAAEALGIRSLQMGHFGRHSLDQGIFATPPALQYLNKAGHLPGAVNPLSELSNNERIRTLQALPIVGNIYGMSALFNSLKE